MASGESVNDTGRVPPPHLDQRRHARRRRVRLITVRLIQSSSQLIYHRIGFADTSTYYQRMSWLALELTLSSLWMWPRKYSPIAQVVRAEFKHTFLANEVIPSSSNRSERSLRLRVHFEWMVASLEPPKSFCIDCSRAEYGGYFKLPHVVRLLWQIYLVPGSRR